MNQKQIEKDKRTVEEMIRFYCFKREGNQKLCDKCKALLVYAQQRLDHCPIKEKRTNCRKCSVHCYNPEMKKQIRCVMLYSGPRMLIYNPLKAIRHFFQ